MCIEQYKKAVRENALVTVGIVKAMTIGPPRVGKTCLRSLLLGKVPPRESPSTSVIKTTETLSMTTPTQKKSTIVSECISTSGWEVIDTTTGIISLLDYLQQRKRTESASDSECLDPPSRYSSISLPDDEDVASISDDQSLTESFREEVQDQKEHSHITSESEDESPGEKSFAEKLYKAIANSSEQAGVELFDANLLQFLDTGGQISYHDILPVFITTPAIYLHVFNLNDPLDSRPTDCIQPEGRGVLTSVTSPLTTLEMISRSAMTVHSLANKNVRLPCLMDDKYYPKPKMVIVGTHIDKLVETHREELKLEDKLHHISRKLDAALSGLKFSVIKSKLSEKEIMFHPVDNYLYGKDHGNTDAKQRDTSSVDSKQRDTGSVDSKQRDTGSVDLKQRNTGSVDSTQQDTGSVDSKQRDTGSVDSKQRDTGSMDSKQRDTDSMDLKQRNTGSVDSTQQDTGSVDSKQRDTGSVDSKQRDTGSVDSKQRDTGSVDSKQRNTGSVDSTQQDTGSVDSKQRDTGSVDSKQRDTIKTLRKHMEDLAKGMKFEIPVPWYLQQLILTKECEEKPFYKYGDLLKVCKANRVVKTDSEFYAMITLFHNLGLVVHHDVGDQPTGEAAHNEQSTCFVFSNPSFLYENISRLYSVQFEECYGWKLSFKTQGLLQASVLTEIGVDDELPQQWFMDLLVTLFIGAEVSRFKGRTLFVPSVLLPTKSDSAKSNCPTLSLMFEVQSAYPSHRNDTYIPCGVFTGTIARLQSQGGWHVSHSGSISRTSIVFEVGSGQYIQLTDCTQYITIDVLNDADTTTCQELRDTVFDCIQESYQYLFKEDAQFIIGLPCRRRDHQNHIARLTTTARRNRFAVRCLNDSRVPFNIDSDNELKKEELNIFLNIKHPVSD